MIQRQEITKLLKQEIGDKSMTLHRVTDKDGNIQEHETRKNIKNDEELEALRKCYTMAQIRSSKEKATKRCETREIILFVSKFVFVLLKKCS